MSQLQQLGRKLSRPHSHTNKPRKSDASTIAIHGSTTALTSHQLFHLASQQEARTNTEIAASTAKVAEQTRRDSASMITIAAVTMFFLPGTFVCAVLSTTFFEHGRDALEVSTKWWILPAVTIPLTTLVFVIWLGWQFIRFGEKGGREWLQRFKTRKAV